jgi:hypothetical protein
MAGADKRAKLLSDLLAAKGDASGGGGGSAEPARAPVIHIAERRQSEDRPSEAPSTPNVLYNKGAATASTFRPSYWSFDHQQAPAPSAAPARVEPTLPAADARAPKRLPVNFIIGFGCLALMVSTTLFVLSLWKRPEPPALQPQISAAATATEPVVALPPPPPPQPQPQPVAAPPAPAPVSPSASTPASVAPEAPPPTVAAPGPQSPVSPAPSVAAAPTPGPNPDTDALLARGDNLLATGDVAAARLFYQRAAEQGNAAAATAVGQTYDPAVLDLLRVRGVRGDAQLAAEWYRKAMAAGDRQAEIRLKRLLARTPG